MIILQRLRALFANYFAELTGLNLAVLLLSYTALSWAGLSLAGEHSLTSPGHFFYWLIITASTVGYGDLSPETTMGRLWTIGFIVPAGLSLFALTIGRIGAFAVRHWQKGIKGMKDFRALENHILVIGWNDTRTLHLLELLLKEESMAGSNRAVMLAATSPQENPMP